MEEQIQNLITRYTNSMDSWKYSSKQYQDALNSTPIDNEKAISHWETEMRIANEKAISHWETEMRIANEKVKYMSLF